MENLNRAETYEFLETFLSGLLEVGLLQPLQRLEESKNVRIVSAARTLYAALVTGLTPQVAVGFMSPRFRSTVELLIINGFEQSNIDFVLKDILSAYQAFDGDDELGKTLEDLLEKYTPLKTDAICIACWTNEIQKLFRRAHAERSDQVILSWEEGRLVQKYIAAKLVTLTEPAVPAVYVSLQNAILDLSKQGKDAQNEMGLDVTSLSREKYQLILNEQPLIVSFQFEPNVPQKN